MQANTTELVIDPLCGMKVDPSKIELVTTYQACSYHFCAEGCRRGL
jgi:Cu+-exporting ATPase